MSNKEITPVVHYIFTQSTELTQANVAPNFKKDSKLQEVNYRPVFLICINCIHILADLEDHNFFTDLKHSFRSGRSWETQFVATFQDLALSAQQKNSLIDIAVLDFSKAFDPVPHYGFNHAGIYVKIWQYTKCCS